MAWSRARLSCAFDQLQAATSYRPHRRCQGLVLSFVIAKTLGVTTSVTDESAFNDALSENWEQLPHDWVQVDLGYWIVNEMAKVSQQLAQIWHGKLQESLERTNPPSQSLENAHYLVTRLMIRAFIATLRHDDVRAEDVRGRLDYLINASPNAMARVELWSELGIRAYHSDLRELLTDEIKSYVSDELRTATGLLRDSLIRVAPPALYLSHAASAENLFETMENQHLRERAYSRFALSYFANVH
jgi:hypothetical protein